MKIRIASVLIVILLIIALFPHPKIVESKIVIKPEEINLTYGVTPEFKETRIKEDKLRGWFEHFKCPLAQYTEYFIEVADKNYIDWRLLPAISMQESSCGKHYKHNNIFGYGYYEFHTIPEAIDYVGSALGSFNPKEKVYNKARSGTESGHARRVLQIYNGTVNPNYPDKVLGIMERIGER